MILKATLMQLVPFCSGCIGSFLTCLSQNDLKLAMNVSLPKWIYKHINILCYCSEISFSGSSIPQKPVLKEEARNPPLMTKVAQDRRSNYNKFVREQSKTQIEKSSFKSPTKLQHSKKVILNFRRIFLIIWFSWSILVALFFRKVSP